MTEAQKLRTVLAALYERCSDEVRVNPAWLATQAMAELDPDRISPEMVYIAAHLEMRQLARGFCRQKFEDGDEAEMDDLFPVLQKRYPAAPTEDGEPQYVLRDHLTEEDVLHNVNRLRSAGQALLRHADALAAWWQDRAA
jgi:hypothetical protein